MNEPLKAELYRVFTELNTLLLVEYEVRRHGLAPRAKALETFDALMDSIRQAHGLLEHLIDQEVKA